MDVRWVTPQMASFIFHLLFFLLSLLFLKQCNQLCSELCKKHCVLMQSRTHFSDGFHWNFSFNLVTSDDTGWEFHQQFEISEVILQYKNQNACLIKCYTEKNLQVVLLLWVQCWTWRLGWIISGSAMIWAGYYEEISKFYFFIHWSKMSRKWTNCKYALLPSYFLVPSMPDDDQMLCLARSQCVLCWFHPGSGLKKGRSDRSPHHWHPLHEKGAMNSFSAVPWPLTRVLSVASWIYGQWQIQREILF